MSIRGRLYLAKNRLIAGSNMSKSFDCGCRIADCGLRIAELGRKSEIRNRKSETTNHLTTVTIHLFSLTSPEVFPYFTTYT